MLRHPMTPRSSLRLLTLVRRCLVGSSLAMMVVTTASAQGTRFLRRPAVSRELVAFEYGGDLWVVPRTGGEARRLTSTPSEESDPYFSPDGSQIAFSATISGNTDVFVVPVAGGEPKRLTYHPGADFVRGWTPDGKRVVFASSRGTLPTPGANSYLRLWTVGIEGGMPVEIPIPRAFTGTYSPDGKRIAYQALGTAMFAVNWAESQSSQWRRYRGGRTQPIRVEDVASYAEEKLPWSNTNDTDPMWVGNTVYYLSDRDSTVNLFAHNLESKQLTQLTHHRDYDIMSASAGPDAIAYEQAGYIHLVDLKTGESRQLNISVHGDFPWSRPQMKKVAALITEATLSPTGVRAAFEARGDIFTVAATDGSYRNITQSSGAHDREPAWSPDGNQIAWLSDPTGEYQLMIGDQTGASKPRAITLPSLAYFSKPVWSPNAKHILLKDTEANLWVVDVSTGKFTKLDTDTYDDPGRGFEPAWSPDSRWVAYSKSLDSHLRSIFLYSFATGKTYQLTDAMADATAPAFDASGKYLYFLASTNFALNTGWLDMSAFERPIRRSIYLTVLSATEPSPLLPNLSDEPGKAAEATDSTGGKARHAGGEAAKPATKPRLDTASATRVDIAGIQQRTIPLATAEGDYANLIAGSAGTFFFTEAPSPSGSGDQSRRLWQYRLADRKARTFLEGISSYTLSSDTKKLMYSTPASRYAIVPTEEPAKAGDGAFDVSEMETLVDPRAEWSEIFRETWRTQREFFYDAKMHGNDWKAIYDKYSVFVPYIQHRADLAYLIASVGGELTVGHSYLEGEGDVPDTSHTSVGLLGADLVVDNGLYRIQRVYTGGSWNPHMHAPLVEPGLKVAEGDYILDVNGVPLAPPANVYSRFEGTAGKLTTIRVNSAPSAKGSWVITVRPVADDEPLRTQAWIDDNRKLVDKLSGGRLAYVWLPNTAGAGYTAFNRYYFAQQNKQGVIIDERYNQGGAVADYIVDQLNRPLAGYFAERAGQTITMPMGTIVGPKVMIINESAGSGGDALPYYFRQYKLGPLVGTRTWGGLVGTLGVPLPLDNGGITAPDLAFYDLSGKWSIENEGVAPDIEVENTTADVIHGRDAQLERAVAEALKMLEAHPFQRAPRPAPINRVSK
ncbi:MAG TPA: PDZ domain-containing protein [Gemmatimonadaceae bacterium]|nr:PDZ domain-containing protein [Gemmatimonadaceae bacterium]